MTNKIINNKKGCNFLDKVYVMEWVFFFVCHLRKPSLQLVVILRDQETTEIDHLIINIHKEEDM